MNSAAPNPIIPSSPRARAWPRTAATVALVIAAGAAGYALHNTPAGEQSSASGGSGYSRSAGGARSGSARGGRGSSAVVPVAAVTAHAGTLAADRATAGTVVPINVSQVSAPASGTAAQVLAKVGDLVKSGQAIVVLDTTQLKLNVDNARLALQNAQINLRAQTIDTAQASGKLNPGVQAAQTALEVAQRGYVTAQAVYKVGGASQNDVETARSAVDTAQANLAAAQASLSQNDRAGTETLAQLRLTVSQSQDALAQAQLNLANATLRAPFDGQITALGAVQGQMVAPNASAFTVASLASEIKFSVPPSDAATFAVGHQFAFSAGNQRYAVKIDEPAAAPIAQNVALVARLLGTQRPAPGVVGNLMYSVNLAKGVIVPISALQNDGTRTYVFDIESGKAHALTVSVQAQAGSSAVVSGVTANAQVIVSPPPGLLDGTTVTTQDTAATSAAGGWSGAGKSSSGAGWSSSGGAASPSSTGGSSGAGWKASSAGSAAAPTGSNATPAASGPISAGSSAVPGGSSTAAPSSASPAGAQPGADGSAKPHHRRSASSTPGSDGQPATAAPSSPASNPTSNPSSTGTSGTAGGQ